MEPALAVTWTRWSPPQYSHILQVPNSLSAFTMECNLDQMATCLYRPVIQVPWRLHQYSAYSGHCRTAPRETPFGCQVQLVCLLDHLLIVLAGIPNTLQRPTLLYCSLQLRLQSLRSHFSYKPHPLCFAYCSHLSNAATDICPNGDRFRQIPLYLEHIFEILILVKGRYCARTIAIKFIEAACKNWDGRG